MPLKLFDKTISNGLQYLLGTGLVCLLGKNCIELDCIHCIGLLSYHAVCIIQGLSERVSKVKSLGKSQFSHKLSFLSCFRSEISGKFIPYSIQVHHNHPKTSLEVGASNVLSGSGRLH